jgi:hypothetical protein
MSKQFAMMILANIAMGIAFVFSNYIIWNAVNQPSYYSTGWGPTNVEIVPRPSVNGEPVPQAAFSLINYPFWLFWIAIVVNLLFIVWLQRSKGKQHSLTPIRQ